MRKVLLLLVVFSLVLGIKKLHANSGFCENYAILKINGGPNTYYDLQATTANPDFNGANLGSFNIGSNSLILNGAESKFFKCGTDAITYSYLDYRIYKTTASPGSFISTQIFWNSNITSSCNCGGSDELWNATSANIDLLSGLTPGTYYLEVYAHADFTYSSGSGTHYANNGGLNYKATFTVTPVYVTSTAGTSPATYSTLKGAFDAINAGTHQGAISISIYDNTTETASASLNASGSGSANYSGISIQPAGGGARTISGDIAGNLVNLNGASNVTIDGLNSGGNSLSFSNTNTGNASTLRFIASGTNNCQNDILKNCTLLGSTSGTSHGVIIFLSASVSSTVGLKNITVSNCNIGAANSITPRYGIYAEGTATLVNKEINISNNNIYDFFSGTGSYTSGIRSLAGNSDWTITSNKLYQTNPKTFTSSVYFNGISIDQTSSTGNNFVINNNIIGFANSSGTGTTTLSGSASRFRGIYLKVGSTVATTVSGNIIGGIDLTTTAQPSLANDVGFIGIDVEAGLVNLNTNTIGSVLSNSITVNRQPNNGTYPDESGVMYYGGNGSISGNIIAGITVVPSASTKIMGVDGIKISNNSNVTISGNSIGAPSAPLFSNSTTAWAKGVYLESGTAIVNNNSINNLLSANIISGITIAGATSTIYNNFISLGTGITSATTISGIEHSSGASPSVYYNSVRLQGTASSGAANSYALFAGSGLSLTVKDNILYNERTGGTGQHNAIRLGNGVSYTGDYNDLYQTSGTTIGNINGTNYAALTDWKAASGQDANSISASVPFTSAIDLHLNDPTLSSAVLNKGIDIPSITTDIDGDKRRPGCNGTDIGADELYLYSSLSSTSKVWLGKSGTNWCDDCNWESQAVPTSADNVIIQTSLFGNNPVVAAGCTANANDLSINSSSLTVSGGILNVYVNFTNSASFTNSAGTVNFAGSSAQAISSVTDLSFYNLTFSGGGAKNVGFNTTVNGSLGLSNGIVNMSSGKNLVLPAGIGYTGGSSSSYINGTLRKYFALGETSFKYPVGDATHYGPFELDNITGVSAGDYLDGSYSTGVAPGAHHNILNPVNAAPASSGTNSSTNTVFSSYVEYWNLGFIGNSNFKAQVTLYYTNNLFSQLYNKGADWLRVTSWSGVSGGGGDGYFDWGNANPLADESSGSSGSISTPVQLGASALNTVFTFGTTANGVNPLPVLIKSFTAAKETGYNKLNWSAACPGSDLTFEVIRSTDGRNFQPVNKFTASETRCNQPFDFNDYNAKGDRIYYRIKITDKYGKVTYTQVAVLFNERIGLAITGLMPNPVTDVLYLTICSAAKDKIQLTVSDLNGRQIMKLSSLLFAGNNTISLPVKNIAKGIYNISGSVSSGQIITQRFIKQ